MGESIDLIVERTNPAPCDRAGGEQRFDVRAVAGMTVWR